MDGSETKYKALKVHNQKEKRKKRKKKALFAWVTSIECLLICSVSSPSKWFSPSSFSSNGLARDVLIHSQAVFLALASFPGLEETCSWEKSSVISLIKSSSPKKKNKSNVKHCRKTAEDHGSRRGWGKRRTRGGVAVAVAVVIVTAAASYMSMVPQCSQNHVRCINEFFQWAYKKRVIIPFQR